MKQHYCCVATAAAKSRSGGPAGPVTFATGRWGRNATSWNCGNLKTSRLCVTTDARGACGASFSRLLNRPRIPNPHKPNTRKSKSLDPRQTHLLMADQQVAGALCLRCSAPAQLQCPKCVQLGLAKAPYCSQECFKLAWPEHKAAHKAAAAADAWLFCTKRGRGRSDVMPSFTWTGPLRPARIGPPRQVLPGIVRPDYAATGIPLSEEQSRQQRSVAIRTPEEIDRIRRACRVGREVLDAAHAAVAPGVTTDELDRVVHDAMMEAGAYPSPLNYYNFPKSVCTSVNEVICHGIPDQRELCDGDIVNVDVTAFIGGAHGDLNETFCVGKVDESSRELIRVTHDALMKAIEAVKPGLRFRELGDVISRHVSAAGMSVVKTYCGHGIGDLFHCAPNIPHYAHNKAVGVMKEGQVFTIEPMVNLGTWRDIMWPDGWTAVTADGRRSAQFEHQLVVTAAGCEVLTARLPSSPPLWWEAAS